MRRGCRGGWVGRERAGVRHRAAVLLKGLQRPQDLGRELRPRPRPRRPCSQPEEMPPRPPARRPCLSGRPVRHAGPCGSWAAAGCARRSAQTARPRANLRPWTSGAGARVAGRGRRIAVWSRRRRCARQTPPPLRVRVIARLPPPPTRTHARTPRRQTSLSAWRLCIGTTSTCRSLFRASPATSAPATAPATHHRTAPPQGRRAGQGEGRGPGGRAGPDLTAAWQPPRRPRTPRGWSLSMLPSPPPSPLRPRRRR